MNGLFVLPECYVDTCLTETITSCFNQFNHQKGCGNVCRVMQDKFDDDFALGIIDKDKQQITYLQEFELISSCDSLYLYKHKEKAHYIIQISPAIEMFILKAAREKGIDLSAYGFPSELKELTRMTKQISGKNEQGFKSLKKLFIELADTSEFTKLANLIHYLGGNTYSSRVEELEKIMNS